MIKLNQYQKQTTHGMWVRTRDGGYRCGNVKVAKSRTMKNGHYAWYLYMLVKGNWKRFAGRTRLHGYFHQAAAKNGATKVRKPVFEGLKP